MSVLHGGHRHLTEEEAGPPEEVTLGGRGAQISFTGGHLKLSAAARRYLLTQMIPAVQPGSEDRRARRKASSQPDHTAEPSESSGPACSHSHPPDRFQHSPTVVDGHHVCDQHERIHEKADPDLQEQARR